MTLEDSKKGFKGLTGFQIKLLALIFMYIKPISFKLMFTDYYEWMAVFALIPMVLYNGETSIK